MIPEAVIDALAAYRLTRLVTMDDILGTPRGELVRWFYEENLHRRQAEQAMENRGLDPTHLPDWSLYAMDDKRAPKGATLVTCRWCAGMWVAFGVVTLRRVVPGLWAPVARALALSAVSALMAGLEE